MNDLRFKKYVTKLLIKFLILILFFINLKPKKNVTDLFSKILFMLYAPIDIKPKKMCDGDVVNCLAALKFVPGWFVGIKMLENFHDALLADADTLFFDEYGDNLYKK